MSSRFMQPLQPFGLTASDPGLVRGEGAFLFDGKGASLLDLISGLWNVPFGHGRTEIHAAVRDQLEQLPFINFIHETSPLQEQYAEELLAVLPGTFSRICLANSGSEAIELAIKVARKFHALSGRTGKKQIAVLDLSYHGTTYGAMSASGMDGSDLEDYGPVLPGMMRLRTPLTAPWQGGDLDRYRAELLADLDEKLQQASVAAVVLEPVVASGGIFPLPDWYLTALAACCEQRDILVIIDEVATGFGRTGPCFALENMPLQADLICLSKAISNGVIPFGAVALSSRIDQRFCEEQTTINHFSTQNGNLLAVRAGLAVLDLVRQEDFLPALQKLAQGFSKSLRRHLEGIPLIREVRRVGLMAAIDLTDRHGHPVTIARLREILSHIRAKGILVYEYGLEGKLSGLSLFPPYVIEPGKLDSALRLIGASLRRHTE